MKEISYKITTREQIVSRLRAFLGSYSKATFERDCKRFGIQPYGKLRFRPQPYPANTVERILTARGYETALAPMPPLDTAAAGLVTISELRKARRASSKGKAKR